MSTFPTILVAGDGSSADASLLDFTAERVRHHSASRVVLVHAINHASIAAFSTGYTYDPAPLLAELDKEFTEIMSEAKKRLRDAGVASVETAELEGPSASAIVDYAHTHGIDAIVMGTHGRTGLLRFTLGSVADGVLRSAHTPTFTLRTSDDTQSPHSGALKRLLVAVDNCDVSNRSLTSAITLAADEGAEIRLCHVVEANDAPLAEHFFDVHIARAHELRISSVLLEGTAADCIMKEASAWNADMIVIGTRGYRGVQRLILGSVAEDVICHAMVPVLTVPPSAYR